jgi:uncharacterized protein (TIGR00255 family)
MLYGMTGFGSEERAVFYGKVSVELRSTNHKFLEIVCHLPDGLLSLEDKIKKEIEKSVKRGRLTCVVAISDGKSSRVYINKRLLKEYQRVLVGLKSGFPVKNEISLDTIIHLPGVLSLEENRISAKSIWPDFKKLIHLALAQLVAMRKKEGRALANFLKIRAGYITEALGDIEGRFNSVMKNKLPQIKSAEEKAAFLKDADISEELERLRFHTKSLLKKIAGKGPVGKELDFIAQEMQREANTMGAKSCDAAVSSKAVYIKSQVEKIREQAQNVE